MSLVMQPASRRAVEAFLRQLRQAALVTEAEEPVHRNEPLPRAIWKLLSGL
ncbi:hypothetical protein BZL29_7784 [Mycobacterium kansasii]|uniref:Uncharacterized protein n=1 Tax=Mycobacterium kansasii TaxID=1768 RepID=A0A1V3WF88_MYCKA|nr:hypothetical protein BZL29_7784 [Mycobacterium kansasii]